MSLEAAFSRDEILDLRLQIQTQFFKGDARLSVVSGIDVNGLQVRRADGWDLDNLTMVTVVFDDNSNYVSGLQKVVQLKLTDPVYQKMLRMSLTVKLPGPSNRARVGKRTDSSPQRVGRYSLKARGPHRPCH